MIGTLIHMKDIKFKQLFEPLKVGNVTLRNRIIASPIDTHVSKEKATGGASLIVLGGGFISKEPRGRITGMNTNPFQLENRATVKKTRNTLNFWRQGGALVSIELLHSGMYGMLTGTDFVYGVCEGVRADGTKVVEVDEALMKEICQEHYDSAAAAKYMGFDMVTAHFAHGWLPSEFLSPTWNHRTDAYGGSYENRIKFPRMMLQAVRKAVGPDFPIDMRINGKDWIGEGMTLEEVARFLQDMADEGLVDMANISVGADINLKGNIRMASHPNHPHMVNIELSKFIKDRVSIPITVVGGIETPEEAEYIISEGYADAVWVGRAMIADPKWAQKAYEGRSEDITPCLRCLYCFPLATKAKNIGCSVNPRMNKEDVYPLKSKAENAKHVVIVGGGPAGLKAALTAEARGHKVTLLEKSETLGGAIRFTDHIKAKQDLNRYLKYLLRNMENSKVDVRTNFDATPENVANLEPDVLMVAVGAEPFTPPIKGIQGENVIGALDVFDKLQSTKDNIVIIGGGTIGCELSVDLAEYGKQITVVEMGDTLNSTANRLYKLSLEEQMKEYPSIKTMVKAMCSEVTSQGVLVRLADKSEQFIPADQVIVAAGMKSKTQLAQSFFGITPETYILGDAKKVGMVMNATHDAYFFATNIMD